MKFIYKGPLSGVTINKVETILYKGKEVDLPEDNPHIKTLIALGYLTKVENEPGDDNNQSPEMKEGEHAG